jgi:hypothetical protein
MTCDPVSGCDLTQVRLNRRLDLVEISVVGSAAGAAWIEAAARRWRDKIGWIAGNALELVKRSFDRGEGMHKADRVGMQGFEEEVVAGCQLDDMARIHYADPCRHLDEQREIVGDKEDGEATSRLSAGRMWTS